MDLKGTLEALIALMIDDPDATQEEGVAMMVADKGMDADNAAVLLTEVGIQVVQAGKVEAPGGWDAVRDEIQAMGLVEAIQWCRTYVLVPTFTNRAAVRLVLLKESIKHIPPELARQDALIAAGTALLDGLEEETAEVVQLGISTAQGTKDRLTRHLEQFQSTIDQLEGAGG